MTEESPLAHLAAGRATWAGLALDDETFLQYLRARLNDRAPPPLESAADLYLACACAAGVSGAAAAFERTYRSVIERAVARIDRSLVDEATQIVLIGLLVATPDSPPRIGTYGGRSSLRAWLTTVATRATLKLRRRVADKGHETLDGLAQAFLAGEPELAVAKAQHGPELAASFRTALSKLEPRELVLLRLHHVERWSVDRLGALYRVGRSTAARWLAAARERLLETAKGDLRDRLSLTASEIESLVQLLQSNFELSLIRLLGDAEGAEGETKESE